LPDQQSASSWEEKKAALEQRGVEVLVTKEREGRIDLRDLMRLLGEKQMDGILLEGGSTLNYAALQAGIVNSIEVYLSPKIFGGEGTYTPVGGCGVELASQALECQLVSVEKIEDDMLMTYRVKQGKTFGG
jgi:diaminohydroxyphosphoribosylaminopyrimidine deaminase/5-amino-6-(5-phosphoribosylamino)uracil reductase